VSALSADNPLSDIGELRGIDTVMMDMIDHPDWLHKLLAFMRDGILKVPREAEAAGDWSLGNHINQNVCYGGGLPDPAPNSGPVPMNQLWGLMAAQEMTLISPAMHDEFMLQYQIPICKLFGQILSHFRASTATARQAEYTERE
jgi:hypothetical protein